MDELLKLQTLLVHWSQHNDEHAESYCMWADKIAALGHVELSSHMRALCQDAKKLREHFEKAIEAIPHDHGGAHCHGHEEPHHHEHGGPHSHEHGHEHEHGESHKH